jgi:hypothetical protein
LIRSRACALIVLRFKLHALAAWASSYGRGALALWEDCEVPTGGGRPRCA